MAGKKKKKGSSSSLSSTTRRATKNILRKNANVSSSWADKIKVTKMGAGVFTTALLVLLAFWVLSSERDVYVSSSASSLGEEEECRNGECRAEEFLHLIPPLRDIAGDENVRAALEKVSRKLPQGYSLTDPNGLHTQAAIALDGADKGDLALRAFQAQIHFNLAADANDRVVADAFGNLAVALLRIGRSCLSG